MIWKKRKKLPIHYFVSIGAGLNQVPLIDEARKLGYHVIGVDYNAMAPGFMKCDLKIQESIENHNEIYQKLREFLFDGEIVGIMTKSYGAAIRTASYLSERFDLPFFPYSRSNDFIDKKIMKSIFVEHGILTPELLKIKQKGKAGKIDEGLFPIICKPTVGHAKIDVRLLKNNTEFKEQLDNLNKEQSYLFERFIEGDEIIAAGIIYRKKFFLVDITDKQRTPKPYFADLAHISPSEYYDLFDEITAVGQKITDAFDIVTAPLIMEFVVSESKELYLIEAVPEFGGEFLADILIPARTRYNYISEVIRAATGKGFKEPGRKKKSDAVVVKYLPGEKGTLVSCSPEGPMKIPGIIFSRIFKEIGSRVVKPRTNLDRLGVVVVRGRTVEEALATADEAAESFNIRIKKR
ncbi:MAG: ATP-grasp domain-containing protein [bacterium]|nr:ATP-grasp domain-containing protein [bacterium]